MATGLAATVTTQPGSTGISVTTIIQGPQCGAAHGGVWYGPVSNQPICQHDEVHISLSPVPGNGVDDWKYGFLALDKTIYVGGQYVTCPQKTANLIIPKNQLSAQWSFSIISGGPDDCFDAIQAHRISDE